MEQDANTTDAGGLPMVTDGKPAKATRWAMAIAAVLLATLVLPAEYGIDLTGAGRVLGLTAMGERKMAAAVSTGEAIAATPAPSIAKREAGAADRYASISILPLRHDEIEVKLAPQG